MRNQIILFLILSICTRTLNAQNLSVPDSILNELTTIKIPVENFVEDSLIFKVVYPNNYDANKTYPVLLGLSGGNQNEKIVNYCYAAWFKSDYFKNHITILPVNKKGKNLLHYSKNDINNTLTTIKKNFHVTNKNWIVAGTSNGGQATFNFISEDPSLFEGGIVIPGALGDSVNVDNSWKHLNIILAYGSKDSDDWAKGSKKTKKTLSKYVNNVKLLKLKGQGHILPIDFDIDSVYKIYFKKL